MMVLVVNLNASIDKRYELPELVKGRVMRARQVHNTPGGKGLHVANVTTILGEACLATGFLGGKNGEFIAEALKEYGIRQDFVKIAGNTRSCLAIITDDGIQTEILEPGPVITEQELSRFMEKYKALLIKARAVTLSGSVPRGISNDIYAKLIQMAKDAGKKTFLDTSGELLKEGIAARPYFIKPNRDEVEALTGRRIKNQVDAVAEIKYFLDKGIELVAVSLGADGSLVGYKDKIYQVGLPEIKAVNPVGSGDAYVAGMMTAICRNMSIKDAIKLASACGTANAMEKESGFVRKTVVEALLKEISINTVEI